MGEDATGRPSGRRVTVDEAARALGLSVDAVRKRIQRGTIAHEKDPAGRVRIILDDPETLQDERQDTTGPASDHAALIEELRDRIRSLERRLDEEQEARRRTDTILAQLARANEEQARTIRAASLEAPSEPTGAPSEATEASEDTTEPRSGTEGDYASAERPQPRVDWPSGSWHTPETDVRGPGEAWDSSRQEKPQEPEERLSWWRRWFGG